MCLQSVGLLFSKRGGGVITTDSKPVLVDRVIEAQAALQRDGIFLMPDFLSDSQLHFMRSAFESRLRHMRLNDVDGYYRTERFRLMVEDVLTLDQGFIDAALHPLVKQTLREYIGPNFELVEAKAWKSLPTRRDFHGWHGDMWYDQTAVTDHIPREVKLAVYLTDVNSGFFEFVRGSHRKQAPRIYRAADLANVRSEDIVQVRGRAGTAFLFDTSGIHRQSVPILEPRYAIFYNYHDPDVPLQTEDVEYYRYHPLVLNAAFLGGLSTEDHRVLGFGNETNYVPNFSREHRDKRLRKVVETLYNAKIAIDDTHQRIRARLKRMFG